MERRELIQWLVATAGLPSLAFGREVHRRPLRRSLSAHVERTLTVAAERILPGAGAAEANVGAFIDKMLADWHTPEERRRFLAGLPELDSRCRARGGGAFADSAAADQVAVLTALDEEVTALRASGGAAANQHWFAMLKYLTVYGWCTSEAGTRELGLYPMAGRYDGCAPV
jgi:hypothetical protein